MLDTKVSELTVSEFKTLVREIVEETLAEMLVDPDEGLELTDEMKSALRHSIKMVNEGAALYDVDEVVHRLGLEN
jgi:hypothetical protein